MFWNLTCLTWPLLPRFFIAVRHWRLEQDLPVPQIYQISMPRLEAERGAVLTLCRLGVHVLSLLSLSGPLSTGISSAM